MAQKKKINARLEISRDKTLSNDFLSKIESSTEEALYRMYESPAEIKVNISDTIDGKNAIIVMYVLKKN